MIFFKDLLLAEKLKNNALAEKSKVLYLLILVIPLWYMSTAHFNANIYYDYKPNTYDFLFDAMLVVFPSITIILTYLINKKGDNKNFLERYICLILPTGIKSFTYLLPLLAVGFALDSYNSDFYKNIPDNLTDDEIENYTTDNIQNFIMFGFYSTLVFFLMFTFNLWRLTKSFKIASGQKD